MAIHHERFRETVRKGCRWDSDAKEALFVVTYIDDSGKRKRVRRVQSFKRVSDAVEAYSKFATKVRRGERDDSSTTAERESMDALLATYVKEHWETLHIHASKSTQKTNAGSVRNHIEPFFGKRTVRSIGRADLEDFVAAMKKDGYAPDTINLALRVLKKILRHANSRRYRDEVPAKFPFVKSEPLALELSDDEQVRFLAAFEDEKAFRALITHDRKIGRLVKSQKFGFKERRFGGGMRGDSNAAGEYFQRLQKSRRVFVAAIDLGFRFTDLRLLRRQSVDLQRGIVSIVTKKTRKLAVVPMSDRCRTALLEAMKENVTSCEYVFTTEKGKPYGEKRLREYFAIVKRIAGITRRFRVNDLRHTFASNLAAEMPLTVIRDALGHTSTKMSERYARPGTSAIEAMRTTMNRRNAALSVPQGVPLGVDNVVDTMRGTS